MATESLQVEAVDGEDRELRLGSVRSKCSESVGSVGSVARHGRGKGKWTGENVVGSLGGEVGGVVAMRDAGPWVRGRCGSREWPELTDNAGDLGDLYRGRVVDESPCWGESAVVRWMRCGVRRARCCCPPIACVLCAATPGLRSLAWLTDSLLHHRQCHRNAYGGGSPLGFD